jgi:2-dehydro-3-deoxygalactonokinase
VVWQIVKSSKVFCVVDWGSSHGRAWFISNGVVVDELNWNEGILNPETGNKQQYLDMKISHKIFEHNVSTVLAVGMIGSKNGILETHFLSCPVSFEKWISESQDAGTIGSAHLRIFPGVSTKASPKNLPGVMRGEEYELFSTRGRIEAPVIVLPGTHSKWVWIENGEITNFETYPTGEMFQQWKTSGAISSLLPDSQQISKDGFSQGLSLADQSDNVGATLFSLRASHLLGGLAAENLLGVLSGVLIGSEVRSGLSRSDRPQEIAVVGSGVLADLYERALFAAGLEVIKVTPDPRVFVKHWVEFASVRSES